MKRRTFLKNSSATALLAAMPALPKLSFFMEDARFGVADASYMMRRFRNMDSELYPPFTDALQMIDHCTSLGFGGVQVGVGGWDATFAKKIQKRKEELDIFLEAQISLPNSDTDIARFEQEVQRAKTTGITIFRTACLSGRRYESFASMEAFLNFKKAAIASLQRAEPIVRKHQVKLAIENHKDWRTDEFIGILNDLDSEWIGVTLDTGNNIALLEDPMEVVAGLAPYAFSVHLKDMAVQEYDDGFLLSEMNLGEGYLDIEAMISTIKNHNPNIRFNLEMITRDPLEVPCLTEKYWSTFDQVSAKDLGRFLHRIKAIKTKRPLAVISDKTIDEQLRLEVENNRTSLHYAKQNLGFK